jgi:hypothetical protein
LIQKEMCAKGVEVPESSSEAEDNRDVDIEEEGSGEDGGDGSNNSDDGDDDRAEASSENDDSSPKVDITS